MALSRRFRSGPTSCSRAGSAVTEVAAVLGGQGRVRVVHAGIDVGDDDTAAEDAFLPHSVCPNTGHSPLWSADLHGDGVRPLDWSNQRIDPLRADLLHAGEAGQRLEQDRYRLRRS